MSKEDKHRPCIYDYDSDTEVNADHCIGWKKLPCDRKDIPDHFSSAAWKYKEESIVDSFMNEGVYKTYGGGSYITELEVNLDVSTEIVSELQANKWIDRATRAVILDFTLFCPNINGIVYSSFIMEVPETGGVIPHYKIHPFLLSRGGTTFKVTEIICEVLFSLFILFLTFVIIWNSVKKGKRYVANVAALTDFLIWFNGVVTLGFYFKRKVEGIEIMAQWKKDSQKVVSFKSVALWDDYFLMAAAILLFLSNLRVLGMLSYSQRLGVFINLIKKSFNDILMFSFIFLGLFMVYAFCGFLLFGSSIHAFRTIYTTLCSLMASLVESDEFSSVRLQFNYMGHIYYFVFVFFMVVIMMTIFVAILYESMHALQQSRNSATSGELLNYLFDSVEGYFWWKRSGNSKGGMYLACNIIIKMYRYTCTC